MKKKRDFEKNITEYQKYTNGYRQLGERERVITNIDVMQKEITKLLSVGMLKEGDWKHDLLRAYITDATKYLSLSEPTTQDISLHYSTCSNFNSMLAQINGGEGNV